jgi:hypothetical protein
MKWVYAMMIATAFAVADTIAGAGYNPGETGELTDGAVIKGVVLVSTNASATAKVKAVYDWPIWGEETRESVKTISYTVPVDKVETLTNWCDYVTENYVVDGSTTNFYEAVTVVTNRVLATVEKPETNRVTVAAIVGKRSVTNDLYSITASGGIGSSSEKKMVGAGGRLIISGAPVTIFWE